MKQRKKSIAELVAEKHPELVEGTTPAAGPAPVELVMVSLAEVEERPIEWVWPGRIVRGALNLLEGDPEAGKSSVAYDLLARLTVGAALPDGAPTTPHRVLIVGAEDALESIVRPRMRAAGADLGMVQCITGTLTQGCTTEGRLVLPDHLPVLEAAMVDADLLYLDGSVNDLAKTGLRSGDDFGMRELLGGIADACRRTGCTAWVSRHLAKGRGSDPLLAGSGTMGIAAKARSVQGVYRDPRDHELRLFARVKCNVAAPVPTLAFRLEARGGEPLRVAWCGEDPRSAGKILRERFQFERGTEKDGSAARRWLAEQLADGEWHRVTDLQREAEGLTFGWKAIEKAKKQLEVETSGTSRLGRSWRDPASSYRQKVGAVGGGEVVGVVGGVGAPGDMLPPAPPAPTTPTTSPRAREGTTVGALDPFVAVLGQ